MKLAALFSGGKDSTYSIYIAHRQKHEISCLISIKSENANSYMFHTPNIDITELQAKSLNIPLISVKTRGEKDKELIDLEKAIIQAKNQYNINGVITGAIESVYQSSRIQRICNKHNLLCINPLWKKNQKQLLEELIKYKFNIIISSVAAYPFTEEFLGKQINLKTLKKLTDLEKEYKINIAGEGGEYETLVLDMPMFKKSLKVINANKYYKDYNGLYNITKITLEQKQQQEFISHLTSRQISHISQKYENKKDILIIGTLSEEHKELEYLYYLEFVKPVENIIKKNNLSFTYFPFYNIDEDIIKEIIKNHKKIIMTGTYLQDNKYFTYHNKFRRILEESINSKIPSFYICSALHLLMNYYNIKTSKNIEIGFKEIDIINPDTTLPKNNKTLKVFELHNNSVLLNKNKEKINKIFNILATSKTNKSEIIQFLKLKNQLIYASQFHPEVRNNNILQNFLRM